MSEEDQVSVDMAIRALESAIYDLLVSTREPDRMGSLVASRRRIFNAAFELQGVVESLHRRLAA